jgi:peptide/histidine transporter 3/4
MGVGAVHANMAVFGAEQIREQSATTQYFDKYYVAVNTGSLLAFGVIAYIQQNRSYFIGYVISTGLLSVTLIFFLVGYRYYIHVKPHDSVITHFFPVLFNAFQTWRNYRQYAGGIVNKRRSSHRALASSDRDHNGTRSSFNMNERPISFFDYAKVANNGRFQDRVVDDIKSLRRIILMFLLLIPYWLIYLQVKFSFSKLNMFQHYLFRAIQHLLSRVFI